MGKYNFARLSIIAYVKSGTEQVGTMWYGIMQLKALLIVPPDLGLRFCEEI
jgi:hypothetical protein